MKLKFGIVDILLYIGYVAVIMAFIIIAYNAYNTYNTYNRLLTSIIDDYMNFPNPIHKDKLLKGVDVIYWINLERSTQRRTDMEELFTDPAFTNIPIERISAKDGKMPHTVYPKLELKYKQKNDYEYACLLSHLETVRKFSETNYDVGLIMEDDITLEFKPYWKQSVQEVIANAPDDWEIIQLCYITTHVEPTIFNLYQRNTRNLCVSAAAYMIKNSAAKKLMNKIYKNNKYTIDPHIIHHADCFLFNQLVTYTYKYPYFIYKTNNDSLLHPKDLPEHELSKRMIVDMYNSLE